MQFEVMDKGKLRGPASGGTEAAATSVSLCAAAGGAADWVKWIALGPFLILNTKCVSGPTEAKQTQERGFKKHLLPL